MLRFGIRFEIANLELAQKVFSLTGNEPLPPCRSSRCALIRWPTPRGLGAAAAASGAKLPMFDRMKRGDFTVYPDCIQTQPLYQPLFA